MRPDGILSPELAARRFLDSLAEPTRILVAISGGSDSTGLLLSLAEALKAGSNSQTSLCAATVDHALRAESADEARQVATLCQSLNIPHVTCIWQGEKPKTGIMAAAREARYGLLADTADKLHADLIVTAHTFDDQQETLAMRGLRSGQGSTGIADAVLFDRRIWIARPFLPCLRADIRNFLQIHDVSWFDDPSNEDIKYERVRTRRHLAKEGASLSHTNAAGDQRQRLGSEAGNWLDQYFTLHQGVLGRIASADLGAEPHLLEYALGRLAAVFGGQPFPPPGNKMRRVLDFLKRGTPGRVTAGRVVFDLRSDGLYLARESRGILPLLLDPGTRGIWDGRFSVENRDVRPVIVEAGDAIPAGDAGKALPKAAFKRALAAFPNVSFAKDEGFSAGSSPVVRITPYFAPFDRFLTRFDLIFADRLAAAFGTCLYPRPPLGLIDGKTI